MVTQALSLISQILALLCGHLLLIACSQNDNFKYLHGAEKPHQVWLDTKHLSDAVLLQLYAASWASDTKGFGFVFLSIILLGICFHTITFCPGQVSPALIVKVCWQGTALSRCNKSQEYVSKASFFCVNRFTHMDVPSAALKDQNPGLVTVETNWWFSLAAECFLLQNWSKLRVNESSTYRLLHPKLSRKR